MTDPVVTYLSRWLGLGSDERLTDWRCSFGVPGLDDQLGWLIAACVVIVAGSLWYYLRWQPRRRAGPVALAALCRAAVFITTLLILAEPGLRTEIERRTPASVWLLFDNSETMHARGPTTASTAPPTRMELVHDALLRGDPNPLERLRGRFRVDAFVIAPQGSLKPIEITPSAANPTESRLALSETSHPSPRTTVRARPVSAHGHLGAALDQVARRCVGDPPAGVVLFSDFNVSDGPQTAEAARKLHVPVFAVGVGPLVAIEQGAENHESKQNGMNSVLRVLLAEYEPSWEWRYLKETLLRDPRVGPEGFRTFLRSADPQIRGQDPLFRPELPRNLDELQAYDVVVLGDLPPAALGTRFCEQMKEFVERWGGGLVVTAGPRFGPELGDTPLADLLPVVLETEPSSTNENPFQPRLTITAEIIDFMQLAPGREANNVVWQRLDTLAWFQPARAVRPQATVLLEHPTAVCSDGRTPQPLAALRRAGRGEVLYLAFNETWRLRRPAGPREYRRFWTTAIRRLAANRAAADQRPPETTAADGSIAAPGAARNGPLQKELARVTGGKACELDELARVFEDLQPPERWQTTIEVVPLWSNWAVFVAVVSLMLTEWWARKRMNLP